MPEAKPARALTADALWSFFCLLDTDCDYRVTLQDVQSLAARLPTNINADDTKKLFDRAVASKHTTKVSKTDLEFQDFQRIFAVRRRYLTGSKKTSEHGNWTIITEYPDHEQWLELIIKAIAPQEPFEPSYEFQTFRHTHTTSQKTAAFQKEATRLATWKKNTRKTRRKANSQLTPRRVQNTPYVAQAAERSETPQEVQDAENDEEFIFQDTLNNAQEGTLLKSNFTLKEEFHQMQRSEQAMLGNNTSRIDNYEESYKDDGMKVPFHQNDQLAKQRDKKSATQLMTTRLMNMELVANPPKKQYSNFTTLTAPPNNTEHSNRIAKYNNPIRGTYQDRDVRTNRQILRDEENDPRKLAFASSKQEVARLMRIQHDPREPYKWSKQGPPPYDFFKQYAEIDNFRTNERIANYHNQMHPGIDINTTVGDRRRVLPNQGPLTDRTHDRSRRPQNQTQKISSARRGYKPQAQFSQTESNRPFGFKLRDMPISKELATGKLHCTQTVREKVQVSEPNVARVSTKLRTQEKLKEAPWVETKMGILRVEEKRRQMGDIDHLLVDTQHPLRRAQSLEG